jgi:hypothetical protein
MTTSTWARTVEAALSWDADYSLICSVPQGSTLLRAHFGWGWSGVSAADVSYSVMAQNLQVMGLVTTVGDGSEVPPNARTAAGDADPPTERWLYWEARATELVAVDPTGTTAYWSNSLNQAPVDTKGMVSAKTIAADDDVNLWASWAPSYGWDVSGSVNLWYWASVLYQTP